MKQPVVLQVLPRLRSGGVERGTVEIAGAIKRSGWQSLVASEGGALISSLTYAGSEHITLPLASKNPLRMWRNAAALEKIIRERKVDIVHARSRAPAWSAYYAAKRAGAHFVTTFHGIYGLEPQIKKRYNEVMVKGERIVAVSHFIADHIAKEYQIDPAVVRTIYRGIDASQFDPAVVRPQRMADLMSKWRVPDDMPLILLPGRITRLKGQLVTIDALAKLPHRNFLCLFVGDDQVHPRYRQEVEDRVREKDLEGYIRIAGDVPTMAEAYMLADVVLAPSIEPEAFGRVPVEAQAMGRLVIASNHGGVRETVIDGETGWLVKPDDAEDLSGAIGKALSLPKEEKERIGAHAMAHVRTHFSSEVMCAKTLDTYWELIGNRYE